MRYGAPFVIAVILYAVVGAGIARAEPPAPEQTDREAVLAEAREAMQRGLEALDANAYARALESFRRAIELVPEANLPRKHAARALEGLSRWAEAVLEYEEYLRIKPDVRDAGAVRDRIAEIRARHLDARLTFACEPKDSRVAIDGGEAVPGGVGTLRVPPGKHIVEVTAPGHVPMRIHVDVAADTTTPVRCALERSSAPTPRPLGGTARAEGPGASPWYAKWWTWTIVGAVALGAGATAFALTRDPARPPATEGGDHRFP